MRVCDALAAIRSPRFDMPLTYAAENLTLQVGDVVRVPLGSREVIAYVVSPVRDVPDDPKLKAVLQKCDVPRAFDETGLHLARFVADRYICTLGEALRAIVLAGAVPRMVDSFERTVPRPNVARYPSVPSRLVTLIWDEFPDGFALETLLRHPDARRAGDRAALLRHVQTLTRSGDLHRVRRLIAPKTGVFVIDVLHTGAAAIAGSKARALTAFVRENPGVPRADAVLAGFSPAVIARAITLGAIAQRQIEPARASRLPPTRLIPPATAEQAAALERIYEWLDARAHREALIYGITGSGKTYIYIEAIVRVVRAGGRAIVLVPEISLTPQTARRFEAAFGDRVAVLHSALSERERFDAWQACMRGDVDVVVGARSAVFAPLSDVRLIVVDEAHETSYKQDVSPRYHAVAVARERMRHSGGVVLLGSATPWLESYAAAKDGALELIVLRERATKAPLPLVQIVDMAAEFESGNKRVFSTALTQALADRIERGEKTVLFVNRRGSGGFLLCRACGNVPQCDRCSVSLAVHRSEGLMRCHYCDRQQSIPTRCPACGDSAVKEFGVGTERVAEEVAKLFPSARVVRMDSDTTTRIGDHARLLGEFEGRGDVLIGTQMVAKGLDFPTVTLVGVVAADVGLHVPDFRAAERTFALIAQVCGRSGRVGRGEAIVQTYSPDHPAVRFAAEHDYDGFAREALDERRATGFPPSRRLVYLGIIGREKTAVAQAAARYADALRGADGIDVFGPAPYPIARLNGEWRYRVMLKTTHARALREHIRERILPNARADRTTRLAINVDP
ncbi:MAG TPA: primosomal protein N' [Candidatus Baltobacteraceae bacterium]